MIFFKIGCYALILTCCFHLVGHFSPQPPPADDSQRQLFDLMTNYQFDFGKGMTFTMMGIQTGFSLCFSLLFLWPGVLGLFLVKELNGNTLALRKVAIINTVALAVGTGIGLLYFFVIPNTCFVLCLIFFVLAAIRIK